MNCFECQAQAEHAKLEASSGIAWDPAEHQRRSREKKKYEYLGSRNWNCWVCDDKHMLEHESDSSSCSAIAAICFLCCLHSIFCNHDLNGRPLNSLDRSIFTLGHVLLIEDKF